ncbi:Cdc20/Fizzy family WD repeat protein [Schizosaccharomyces japonicus yFS275]|uniref:Cdc20/Fizzy family WD repeat protein n=1 Tax=Schizosaccharomyces japonicus (strain yFS275 / FY16936) TaxID=402676 RepID=B6K543_SCHJY|nr:Cdc20/Fizzy family WD repeat protein [Schizosaccharomyces japonicus yFS275]EEB08647.1 Cdc20/Fizzy family WD repeat protein [Schizosaccharomyces japonicus yFS275]
MLHYHKAAKDPSPGRIWRFTKVCVPSSVQKRIPNKRKHTEPSTTILNDVKSMKRQKFDRFIPSLTNRDAFYINEMTGVGLVDTTQRYLGNLFELTFNTVLFYQTKHLNFPLTAPGNLLSGSATNHTPLPNLSLNDASSNNVLYETLNQQSGSVETPIRVLDAPGLRDDFYITPLAWSKFGELAVALANQVYLWTAVTGPVLLKMDGSSDISSLAYSGDGSVLAVARIDGAVQLWQGAADQKKLISELFFNGDISCMAWSPVKRLLLIGGCTGKIYSYVLRKNEVVRVSCIKNVHAEQVCGLCWNHDGTMFASGGNDNRVAVFDARTPTVPQFVWFHKAAIKALSFCPWQKSILAVGTGSSDQSLYFYDTFRGNEVARKFCGSQITATLWSRRYREICVALGYSDRPEQRSLVVYRWPQLTPVFGMSTSKHRDARRVRTVMAVDTHCRVGGTWKEGEYIIVANSDETVKFYKIWGEHDNVHHNEKATIQTGIFGSDIVEMLEDIPEKCLMSAIR